MPYCSSCGNLVDERDLFCAKCGKEQPMRAAPPPSPPPYAADPLHGVSARTASILCYVPVVGWVVAVVVLASRRFRLDGTVRFHAFQGLYLFAAWLVVNWAIRPIFQSIGDPMYRLDRVLELVLLGASIFMMVKTSHEQVYSLPIVGDLAHRSATEN
jgi:uncharacterized membrane protein